MNFSCNDIETRIVQQKLSERRALFTRKIELTIKYMMSLENVVEIFTIGHYLYLRNARIVQLYALIAIIPKYKAFLCQFFV